MSLDRPWLQSYPKGVPAEIDVNEFHSVASVFDASVAKFRDRPAYSSFGKVLTYGETDAPATHPPAELAAWTMMANVLMNMDEFVTRE